jgi:hypothetical protein
MVNIRNHEEGMQRGGGKSGWNSLMTSLQSVQASIYTIHITAYYNIADVLYGCDTWSVILREEQRLRVF